MIVYPLTPGESSTIRWVRRIVPLLAAAVIILLGVMTFAA